MEKNLNWGVSLSWKIEIMDFEGRSTIVIWQFKAYIPFCYHYFVGVIFHDNDRLCAGKGPSMLFRLRGFDYASPSFVCIIRCFVSTSTLWISFCYLLNRKKHYPPRQRERIFPVMIDRFLLESAMCMPVLFVVSIFRVTSFGYRYHGILGYLASHCLGPL